MKYQSWKAVVIHGGGRIQEAVFDSPDEAAEYCANILYVHPKATAIIKCF